MAFIIDIPEHHAAIKQQQHGALQVEKDAQVPQLGPGTALVRVKAVALNPTDFKLPKYTPTPGATAGADFAGEVVALGPSVDDRADSNSTPRVLKVGDRVCGSVFGSNPEEPGNGAFAEYVKVDVDLVARIPAAVSWAHAAAIGGVGHSTVALSLWTSCLGLTGTIDTPATANDEEQRHVLVYGASTATGTMALQILKASGYLPLAVCSARNFDLARQYGAVAVFDYTSKTCAQDIRTYTGDELWQVLDCIADTRSSEISFGALGRAGGRYVYLESLDEEAKQIVRKRKAVKTELLIQYEAFGRPVALSGEFVRGPNAERRTFAGAWYKTLEHLLQQGRILPHPVRVLSGGWTAILSGLDELSKGKVSGEKLVVLLDV